MHFPVICVRLWLIPLILLYTPCDWHYLYHIPLELEVFILDLLVFALSTTLGPSESPTRNCNISTDSNCQHRTWGLRYFSWLPIHSSTKLVMDYIDIWFFSFLVLRRSRDMKVEHHRIIIWWDWLIASLSYVSPCDMTRLWSLKGVNAYKILMQNQAHGEISTKRAWKVLE